MDNVFGLGEALAAVKKKSKGRRLNVRKCVTVSGMPGIAVCTLGKAAAKKKARKARKAARRVARKVAKSCPPCPKGQRCAKVKRKSSKRAPMSAAARKAFAARMKKARAAKRRSKR